MANSLNVSSTALVQLLIDPEIRSRTLPFIQDWMIDGDLQKAFVQVLAKDAFYGIVPDRRIFAVELSRQNYITESDVLEAVSLLNGYVPLSAAERINTYSSISRFLRDKHFSQGIELFLKEGQATEDVYEAIRRSYELEIIKENEFIDFSNVEEVEKAKRADLPPDGEVLQSRFQTINSHLSYKGYKVGDLILIVGPPKCGKTTFSIGEGSAALMQGKKVAHVFLGDMSDYDGFCRYVAYLSENVRLDDIIQRYEDFYTPEIQDRFSNLRIRSYPPLELDIQQIMSKCEALYRQFDYDLLIVDYDSNIKETNDNLYKEGGYTYAKLRGHAKDRCVVIVASQPKQHFWKDEILPIDSAGESSKKQHVVDVMLTIGQNKDCPLVGSLHIPVVRRGVSRVACRVAFEGEYGKIRQISQSEYQQSIQRYKDIQESGDVEVDIQGYTQ